MTKMNYNRPCYRVTRGVVSKKLHSTRRKRHPLLPTTAKERDELLEDTGCTFSGYNSERLHLIDEEKERTQVRCESLTYITQGDVGEWLKAPPTYVLMDANKDTIRRLIRDGRSTYTVACLFGVTVEVIRAVWQDQ